MEESVFIKDLALIVVSAGIAAVLFRAIKLPLLMGYLLAGLLISPDFLPFLSVEDESTVRQLSELGVIFLMFYIGMEFDLHKIQRLLGPALAALILQTVAMLMLGIFVAGKLGWGNLEGIFLGGLLAISSSMVTIQVLKERGMMDQPHSQLAIGILILEDILAILLLVVLTGVGVTGHFQWGDVWQVTFFVGVFVVVVYFLGRILVQPLLGMLHNIGSIEVISLVTVAIVLGIGELAVHSHFSAALGAFLAGAILSHSSLADDIEKTTEPLRNLFTAIFFVTIGMLIEPQLIWHEWKLVLALSFTVIVVKTTTCWLGLLLAGQVSHTSFKGAVSKAQIGEFSFVIAALGQSLGVTQSSMTTIAIGVGAVTMLATFPMTIIADGLYGNLAKRAPDFLVRSAEFYFNLIHAFKSRMSTAVLLNVIRRHALMTVAYFLLFNGILLSSVYLSSEYFEETVSDQILMWGWLAVGFAALIPVIGITRNINAIVTEIIQRILGDVIKLEGTVHGAIKTVVRCFLLIFFSGIYLAAAAPHFPTGGVLTVFFLLVFALILIFWSSLKKLNTRIELLFMESFNQRVKSMDEAKRVKVFDDISEKYPWPVNITEYQVQDGSVACGKSIADLNLRKKSGATVIAISRYNHTHFDPNPGTAMFPGDRLLLLGSESETKDAIGILSEHSNVPTQNADRANFEFERLVLSESSPLNGNTLAGANLRKLYGVSVIGIQRDAERITSPSPGEMLYANDLLLVIGKEANIKRFSEEIL